MLFRTLVNPRQVTIKQSTIRQVQKKEEARTNAKPSTLRRQTLGLMLVWALLLSLLPHSWLSPVPVQAQTPIPEDEIVFVDALGFIRVWDPNVPIGKTAITWISPEAGYVDIALGDVNNDGDQEIVAIFWNGIVGQLVVYDPVLNSRALTEDGVINGIPWKELYRVVVPGKPTLVGTGELNTGVNGDEIVYGYEVGASTVINVLRGTAVQHEGTDWAVHIPATFDFTWSTMSVGNADGQGTDEIVLTDTGDGTKDDRSKLHIYRVDTDSLITKIPIFKKSSTNNKWRGTAIGEMKKGGAPELVAYRSVTGAGTLTLFLFQYRPDQAADPDKSFNEADGDGIEMLRRPHWAFMVDINGPVNGVQDYEAFFLREVRATEPDKDRLLVENRGDDSIDKGKTSTRLDVESNWRRGVGANVDGSTDGREEVVIMATNKLRIYRYEASGDDHLKQRDSLDIGTNEKGLAAGDLDAIGFSSGILLDIEAPTESLEILSGNQGVITFQITGSSDGVPINVEIDQTNPMIANVSRGPNSTPSFYQIGINALNLLPGAYSIPVSVTSTDPDVNNSPLAMSLTFDVVPATVTVRPSAVSLTKFPCEGAIEDAQFVLNITGSTGINYSAAVINKPEFQRIESLLTGSSRAGTVNAAGMMELSDEQGNHALIDALITPKISATEVITWASLDWIEAVSQKGTIDKSGTATVPSDTLTVTILASELPTTTVAANAMLLLVTDPRTGAAPNNVISVPISYLCASSKLTLPLVYPANGVTLY